MERTMHPANPYKHSKVHLTLLHYAKRHLPTGQFGALLYCSCSAPTGQCAQPTSPEYEFHVAKPTPDTLGRHMPAYRRLARLYPKSPGSSNLGAVNLFNRPLPPRSPINSPSSYHRFYFIRIRGSTGLDPDPWVASGFFWPDP
jgi:hypothetical protein